MKTSLFGSALITSFLFSLLSYARPDGSNLDDPVANGSRRNSSRMSDTPSHEESFDSQSCNDNFVNPRDPLNPEHKDDELYKSEMFNPRLFGEKRSKPEGKFLKGTANSSLIDQSVINKKYNARQEGHDPFRPNSTALCSDQHSNADPSGDIISSKKGVINSFTSSNGETLPTGFKASRPTSDHLLEKGKQTLNESVLSAPDTCLNSALQQGHPGELPLKSNKLSSDSTKPPWNVSNGKAQEIHDKESSKNAGGRGRPRFVAQDISSTSKNDDSRQPVYEPTIFKSTYSNRPPASQESVLNSNSLSNKENIEHTNSQDESQNKLKAEDLHFPVISELLDFPNNYDSKIGLFGFKLYILEHQVIETANYIKCHETNRPQRFLSGFLKIFRQISPQLKSEYRNTIELEKTIQNSIIELKSKLESPTLTYGSTDAQIPRKQLTTVLSVLDKYLVSDSMPLKFRRQLHLVSRVYAKRNSNLNQSLDEYEDSRKAFKRKIDKWR